MPSFGANFFSTPGTNQDANQSGKLSFESLNFSAGDSQSSNVFSSCMPTLDMVFKRDDVQPVKNQLVDSNLMFDFRQPKTSSLPTQPPLANSTVSFTPPQQSSPAPKQESGPPQVLKPLSDPAKLTEYASNYAQTVGSHLSTVATQREICTNPVIKQFAHSLLTSDGSHIYVLLNTSIGVILLTINVAHGNSTSRQVLDLADYITNITIDPFDDYLVLFSQPSTTIYILNRSTAQVIDTHLHVLSYYSYFSHIHKKTYLLFLVPNELTAGINIHILDLKTQGIHQCPVPIFAFDYLDKEIRRLTSDGMYSFSSTDVMRAHIYPFGTSMDISISSQTHQAQSFQFEESVFYVGLELLLPSAKLILIHSMVGPILLEPVNQRIASLQTVKASDSIKMVSSDSFSVDFYLVQPIQSLVISTEEPAFLTDITPIAICSPDDDVHSHFFLCMCWTGKRSSVSLHELCGAELFLYECNSPITLSLQDRLFSYDYIDIHLYRVMAFRGSSNTSGIGAQVLLLGTKTTENNVHEFVHIVLNVVSASLEETTTIIQGNFPILLGYDPCHQFILCASSTSDSMSIFHKTSQPSVNQEFVSKGPESLLFSQATSQLTTSRQSAMDWLSQVSSKQLFEDSLAYLKNTPINQMDPTLLGAKLKSLNERITAVLSHSFPGEVSSMKTLLRTTESLLRQIFKNNSLLLQAMQQISTNFTQLSREYIFDSGSITKSNNDDTTSSYL